MWRQAKALEIDPGLNLSVDHGQNFLIHKMG